MEERLRTVFVLLSLLLMPLTGSAQKKPDYAPVSVEFNEPPPDMKSGDQVETTLAFRALDDLQRLEVSVAPFSGVEIVSEKKEAVFTDVKEGDAPQLKVTVRLLQPSGSLAVTYTIVTADGKSAGATTIEYGQPAAN
jgi:hypothetical protein